MRTTLVELGPWDPWVAVLLAVAGAAGVVYADARGRRADGASSPSSTRAVALGLIGTWVHLSIHHLVDKLYVANLHLHIGALLGVLSVLVVVSGGRNASPADQLQD